MERIYSLRESFSGMSYALIFRFDIDQDLIEEDEHRMTIVHEAPSETSVCSIVNLMSQLGFLANQTVESEEFVGELTCKQILVHDVNVVLESIHREDVRPYSLPC